MISNFSGGEDLHSLCVYILIKANLMCPFSELMFIAEFIPEKYILGEEGYALATIQAALESLLHPSDPFKP